MADIEFVRTVSRARVLAIVEGLEKQGYSRADAMVRAGSKVGRSDAWVERVISRRDSVTVSALDWLRLEHLVPKIEAITARIDKNTALVLERKREAAKTRRLRERDFEYGEGYAPEFLRAARVK